MSRQTDNELFKELNRTERSIQAKEETLEKLQRRIVGKRRHIFPVFLTGVLAAAAIIILTFFLLDPELLHSTGQGSDDTEPRIFEGSGESWAVEYEATEQAAGDNPKQSTRYAITSHSFDLPENVTYEIRLPDGSVEGESDVPFRIGKTITGTGTCECSLSFEEEIEVSFSWDGKTETFNLSEKVLKPLPLAGSGESWAFSFKSGSFGEKDKFIINYIGKGDPPESIDYEVNGVLGQLAATENSLDGGQLVQEGEFQNLELYYEDQELEIKISWDGKSESFIASPK